MPELKYVITADDSKFRKTLNNASKEATKNNQKLASQVNAALEGEAANRNKVISKIQQQQRSVQSLQIQLQSYQAVAARATDPATLTAYNAKIQQTQLEIGRLSNVGKKGFDSMGNAIKRSRGLIGSLWSGIRKLAYILPGFGIAGILALAIDPIVALVKNMDLFKDKLTETKREANVFSEAFKSADYKNAVSTITELRTSLDLAKKGLVDSKTVINQYNKALGNSAEMATTLSEVEKGLADNAENYIKITLAKAAAQEALQKAVEATAKQQDTAKQDSEDFVKWYERILFKTLQLGSTALDARAEDRQRDAVAKASKERLSALEVYNKLRSKYEKEASDLGFEIEGNLSAREKLLQKIADLQAEYSRKSLTSNEAEIQAVRDKFKKIATEVAKFNADPANKIKITGTGLDAVRDQAIADLRYKQETEALKVELDKQRGLYEDFNAWRDKAGQAAAEKRYGSLIDIDKTYLDQVQDEIAKLEAIPDRTGGQEDRLRLLRDIADKEIRIDREKQDKLLLGLLSFHQKMKALQEKYQRDIASLGKDATKQQLDELKHLYEESVKQLQNSYKYIADGELGKINDEEQIKKGLAELAKYRVDKETELQRKLLKVGIYAARKRIAALKKEQEAYGIDNSASIQNEENFIKRSENHLDHLKSNYLIIGEALGNILAQSSDDFVAKIGKMIQEVSASLGQIQGSETTLGKAQGLVGLITGFGNMLKGIKNQSDSAELNRLKAMTEEVANRLSFEAEINRIQAERAKAENDNIFFGPDQGKVIENAAKEIEDANKIFEDSLSALFENGIFSAEGTGKRNLFGSKTGTYSFSLKELFAGILPDSDTTADWLQGWFTSGWSSAVDSIKDGNWKDAAGALLDPLQIFSGSSTDSRVKKDAFKNLSKGVNEVLAAMGKSVEDFANFSNQELLTFFTLMEEGGYVLDKATKQIIATSKEAAGAALEAEKAMNDAVKSMVGMLGDDLRKAMVDAFKAGEDASKAFGDTVKGVIDDIVADMAFQALYGPALEQLRKEVIESSTTGDGIITDDIKRFNNATKGLADTYEQMLKDAGITRSDDTKQPGTLSGAIKGITVDQADLLAGQFAGMRLAQLETVELARTRNSTLAMHSAFMTQQLNYLNSISVNTGRTADNTAQLSRLESMERSLKSMDRKISSSVNAREAAGI